MFFDSIPSFDGKTGWLNGLFLTAHLNDSGFIDLKVYPQITCPAHREGCLNRVIGKLNRLDFLFELDTEHCDHYCRVFYRGTFDVFEELNQWEIEVFNRIFLKSLLEVCSGVSDDVDPKKIIEDYIKEADDERERLQAIVDRVLADYEDENLPESFGTVAQMIDIHKKVKCDTLEKRSLWELLKDADEVLVSKFDACLVTLTALDEGQILMKCYTQICGNGPVDFIVFKELSQLEFELNFKIESENDVYTFCRPISDNWCEYEMAKLDLLILYHKFMEIFTTYN